MKLTQQLLVMVALSVLLGLGARVVQKQPVPFWGFPKPIALIQPKDAFADVNTVSAEDAFPPSDKPYEVKLATAIGLYSKQKKANVHFIDARDPKLYAEGHIIGATNVPFEKVGEYQDTLNTIPKTELAVLYCDGGDCHLSHDLSEYMISHGWTRVAVYTGGWAEWSKETEFTESSK
jgi:rhodanese-related sulfurtransferase